MRRVMVRQFAGSPVGPHHLQEAEAHQIGAERNASVDHPTTQFEIARTLVAANKTVDEFSVHSAAAGRTERAACQTPQDGHIATEVAETIDQDVDADMAPGPSAICRTEL